VLKYNKPNGPWNKEDLWGGWEMKHLHPGPGNEGVFLRDDSEEEDQRAR